MAVAIAHFPSCGAAAGTNASSAGIGAGFNLRNATRGSTRVARRAGTYDANMPMPAKAGRRNSPLHSDRGRWHRHRGTKGPSEFERRWEILEEDALRGRVERDEAFSKRNPELWRQMEIDRRARNRKTTILNRRLRAEGLRPVALELSLAQRVKKLRQFEARNNARSAKRTAS